MSQKNIRVLDCTLRDGGRIINCNFPDSEIVAISNGLTSAKIDIIEVGFIRDAKTTRYMGNSTFFTDVDQISPFVKVKHPNTIYTAFIDFGLCDIDTLKPYDGSSIDAIRFGFTKQNLLENRNDIIRWMDIIKNRGYKLFVQGVNTLNYSDEELLRVIDMINDIRPYSFGIVDTYGAMYMEDVEHFFVLVNNKLSPEICINFHSHNNYQLSFAFAQEIIKQSNNSFRQVIIDGTLFGMGKVAGNLHTELLVDYLVRKKQYDYELDEILDLIDDYIYKYSLSNKWGFSISALMAGIYKSHPNNVIYLTQKFRIGSKDIGKLLSMIDPTTRQRYDYANIEKQYISYVSRNIDDHYAIKRLKELIDNKEVLILVPGNSLNLYKGIIDQYIASNDVVIISVNYSSNYTDSISFFGNEKRYGFEKPKLTGKTVIASSNIRDTLDNTLIVNYHSLINRGYKFFENSTIMLLNLLKRIMVCKITIAGFDGFCQMKDTNYVDGSFQNDRHINEFPDLNREIHEMVGDIFKRLEGRTEITFLTPSRFDSLTN